MLVHFTRPVPERYIPAWRVLAGNLPDDALDGMIVFIGTSAAGLKDQRATPSTLPCRASRSTPRQRNRC